MLSFYVKGLGVKLYQSSTRLCPWPLLFIIYINDIADKLISLSRLFADDTSFGYSNRDTMQLKNVPRCQTLSNALEKSQNTKQFASFFSNEFKMLL
jgi:hypothetical protein